MKKILFLLTLAAMFLTSCNGNREAMNVARNFLNAYYIDYDFDRARALSTPATHEHMQQWIMVFELTPEELRHLNFSRVVVDDIDIVGTRATVRYRVDNIRRHLLLRQTNGRWLVDMPTEIANNREFSLSHNRPDTGGFASAESRPTRLTRRTEE